MKVSPGVVVLSAAVLVSAVLGAAPARQAPAAAPVPVAAVPAEEGGAPALMAQLTFQGGATVTGRLSKEDDQALYLTSLGGATTAYRRDAIQDVQRFTIPAGDYAEQVGDFLTHQIWKVEDAADTYVKARQQYQAALALTRTAKDQQRLRGKVKDLEQEREAWQAEMVRRQEVKKAQDQAELTRLQKELAQQKLSTLRDHELRLQQQEAQLRRLSAALTTFQDHSDGVLSVVQGMDTDVTQLQQDVDDLQARAQSFVTQTDFDGLRRSFEEIKRDVQRLQRALGAP